jgi:UDPglucose 6-dehydrogenase
MKIAVVGSGYVGLVTAACFADLGHRVTGIDSDRSKIRLLKKGKPHFYEPGLEPLVRKNVRAGRLKFTSDLAGGVKDAEVVFIAVGTPPREGGEADLSQVENVARTVAHAMTSYKLVIEKSTVPVQTGGRIRQTIAHAIRKKVPFDVASNPEFLREGSAVHDFMHPDRIVVGADSNRARAVLKELYKGIKGPLIFTDLKSAEIIKHASNSFLAMKISFINAISRICELAGADVEEVAGGMGLDKRIGRSFLNAGIGFGGFCFPKDLAAFIRISQKVGYDFKLLRAVEEINDAQWRHFVKKTEDALWNIPGKTVGVLGLSFKPNTDDMRYAPSVEIIRALQAQGARVQAYDPQAMAKARKVLPKVKMCRTAYDAAKGADCLLVVTEWDEFRSLDLKKVKRLLKSPLVVDGRNLFRPADMAKAGFRYVSMGRPAA